MELSPGDLALKMWKNNEKDISLLYKYCRINDNSIDALKNGYVYYSRYSQLNDPYDPFIKLITLAGLNSGAGDSSQFLELSSEDDGPKVFCLTLDPLSVLMWAHYGDSGFGMCIGYPVFIGNPRIFNPVQYPKEIDINKKYPILDLLLLKSDEWKYENEWRGCIYSDEQKVDDLLRPVSIYIGSKCTHDNMMKIKEALPETVDKIYMILPTIEGPSFTYRLFDVDDLLKLFNRLPTVDQFIDYVRRKQK